MSCQNLEQHVVAKDTAIVAATTSDLKMFDKIDKPANKGELNDDGASGAPDAS